MIQHVTHVFSDLETLQEEISVGTVAHRAADAQALLIQIYCSEADPTHIHAVTSLIASKLPDAVVVGATTIGEIAHGRVLTNQTIIGFTFFESSQVNVVTIDCSHDNEWTAGTEIGRRAHYCFSKITGVLLLSTSLSINAATLLQGLESTLGSCSVFGGGAGDYTNLSNSLVFTDSVLLEKGAVAVILSGNDLHIELKAYLGWQPLIRNMQVTKANGPYVQSIDGQPAFEVYRRYLNIPNDNRFFLNALEFPFLLERDGKMVARVPVAVSEEGVLQFAADIKEGEIFRIGYGDRDMIIENSVDIHHSMAQFSPQAIFLYNCGCRRFLMRTDAELETLPFETLAPTFGFYTYGEFFGSSRLSLLNSTIVAVGLREGKKQSPEMIAPFSGKHDEVQQQRDPHAHKHARVVSRLLRFINTVTSELEASNREVTKQSITDQLTQLVNRIRLDQILAEQIELANRYDTPFSVILLDLDYFKQVNDTHGHLVGDDVLMRIAHTLKINTRSADTVGRWGGEEFLVIASNTRINKAVQLAEKLRKAIENTKIPKVGYKTGSFGVAEYTSGDNSNTLIARADTALYTAKESGRNRVEIARTI